jgi:hypothetical protein
MTGSHEVSGSIPLISTKQRGQHESVVLFAFFSAFYMSLALNKLPKVFFYSLNSADDLAHTPPKKPRFLTIC